MQISPLMLVAFTVAALFPLSACADTTDSPMSATPTRTSAAAESTGPLSVTSSDFEDGGDIPDALTANAFGGNCIGDDRSPELTWTGGPNDAGAYAVVMLDSSHEDWVHWLVTDIPAGTFSIAGGQAAPDPAVTGRNGLGNAKYFGPCPNSADHVYTLEVWALDEPLGLELGFSHEELVAAAEGHVLETAGISGVRSGPVGGA